MSLVLALNNFWDKLYIIKKSLQKHKQKTSVNSLVAFRSIILQC